MVLRKASWNKVLVIPVILVTLRWGGVGKWLSCEYLHYTICHWPSSKWTPCNYMFTDNGFSVKKSGTWDFVTQAVFNWVPGSYAAPYSLFWHQFYASKKALNSQHSLLSFSPKVLIQPSLLSAGTFLYPPIHFALPCSTTIFCCFFFNQTDSFVCVCVCVF